MFWLSESPVNHLEKLFPWVRWMGLSAASAWLENYGGLVGCLGDLVSVI